MKRWTASSRRRKIVTVLLASALTLALAAGVGSWLLVRHLNHNIEQIPIGGIGPRPEKVVPEGPQEPLNVLVMGSDDRDAPGNNIDNLTGIGKRSDTTILFHLSADRRHAYGISIPRDSIVDRPSCRDASGSQEPAATEVMWNDAFNYGGPNCTIKQFEHLTGVYVDHYVVVDFAGFEGMVDAIGGVEVCIPEPIVDPAHGIDIAAGTREIEGREALNYVRARYTIGNESDLGRIKRQQAFIASMAHEVLSAGILAHPVQLVRFLNAATKSLTSDVGSVLQLKGIADGFKNIGMDNITFLTVPNDYFSLDSAHPGKVFWLPSAQRLWDQVAHDEVLSPAMVSGAITARNAGGNQGKPRPGTPSADEDGLCA